MAKNAVFLKTMPDNFIKPLPGDETKLSVRIPGGENLKLIVDADKCYPSCDKNGNPIAKHSNIKLGAPGDELDVTYEGDDGNMKRGTRSVEAIAGAWARNQAEYADKKGDKVYLNGVSEKMIHDSKVQMNDGSGRYLQQVSVADPESAPQPIRDEKGVPTGQTRESGYGTFLVSPDAITPTASSAGKVNIYLGHENDKIRGYQIYTGEIDEKTGKGKYASVERTAGDIRSQYEEDLKAFKEKMAAKDAGKEAPEAENDKQIGD